MPHIRVWIHVVWSTKNREPFLTKDFRKDVFGHIKENALKKNIYIDFIGGYCDHIHCLISLGSDQNIAKVVQLIKGESSFWINNNRLAQGRFSWQEGYFAVSVSEANVESVRKYIANQEEHHKKKSFNAEFELFLKRARFSETGRLS